MQKAQAQLDTGASISLITRKLATTLKARKIPNSSIQLSGIGGHISTLHQIEITLMGDPTLGYHEERVKLKAHVIDSIPSSSSQADVQRVFKLPFVQGLPLADPLYTSSARIDLLLDVGSFNACCKGKTKSSVIPSLKAELTIFGWAVGGTDTLKHQADSSPVSCLRVSQVEDDPEALLRRFWEVEAFDSDEISLSPEEHQAETHFTETFTRDRDGRY